MGSAIPDEETSSSSQLVESTPQESVITQIHPRLLPVDEDGDPFVVQPSRASACVVEPAPKRTMSKLLKGKEKEWSSIADKKGPLKLLDLPVDILREIINQVVSRLAQAHVREANS